MGQQLAVAGAKWSKWTDPASGTLRAGGPAEDHKMLPQSVKFFRFEIKPEYAHYKNDVVLEVKVVEGYVLHSETSCLCTSLIVF